MRFRISLKMLTNIGPKILGHNAWFDKLTQKAANVRLTAKGMFRWKSYRCEPFSSAIDELSAPLGRVCALARLIRYPRISSGVRHRIINPGRRVRITPSVKSSFRNRLGGSDQR